MPHAVNCENRPWMIVWPAWEISMDQTKAEQMQKQFISIFKTEFNFSITSETNLKIMDFSDVNIKLEYRISQTLQ